MPAVYDFHKLWIDQLLDQGDPFEDEYTDDSGTPVDPVDVPDKALFLVRGAPGAGKSTLAKVLTSVTFENDDFFVRNGKYNYHPGEVTHALHATINHVKAAMEKGTNRIAVANLFKKDKDCKPFRALARRYGYPVFQIVVENVNGSKSPHGWKPAEVAKRKRGFQLTL